MSDQILPDFLPPAAPTGAVLDLSRKLTQDQIASLDGLCNNSADFIKFKIVILPQDFHAKNIDALAEALAKQWKVGGDRLLLVIDLSGHKIRAKIGHGVGKFGVNGPYMTNTAIKDNFLPAIKSGDLYGALQRTVYAVQQQVWQSLRVNKGTSTLPETRTTSTAPAPDYGVPNRHDAIPGLFFFIPVVAFALISGLVLTIMFSAINNGKKRAGNTMDTLSKALNQRSNILFEKADHLGQASEYLLPDKEKELAQQVSVFFARLDTLTKAKEEAEKLLQVKKKEAIPQLKNCILLADALEKEANPLLEKVSAATGQVGQFKSSYETAEIALDQSKEVNDLGQIVPVSQQRKEAPYMAPSWARNNDYLPANYIPGNDNSFLNLSLILNQMNLNWQLSQLSRDIQWQHAHTYPDSRLDLLDHGSGWGDNFDSGGGDWGSSDSGGDWGGSDWDSGGGDWGGDGGGGDW